jgi:hypothetical protein
MWWGAELTRNSAKVSQEFCTIQMHITDKNHFASCHSCLTVKQYRTPQKYAIHANINKFGDLFSCDLNGAPLMPFAIVNDAHYLLIMTDYAIVEICDRASELYTGCA